MKVMVMMKYLRVPPKSFTLIPPNPFGNEEHEALLILSKASTLYNTFLS